MDIQRKYTVKPDPADARDYLFKATKYAAVSDLPPEVDLSPHMSPVVDQGALGSCTANAIASGLREYLLLQDGQPLTRLSRLFLYWHERSLEGTINEDSGAYIRDGMKVLADIGCPPESEYLYDITKFTQQPTAQAETDAAPFKIREYHRVSTYDDLLHALAEGKPVVIGISVYKSFESFDAATSGMIPMPVAGEELLGGHAILAVGYKTFSDGKQRIKFRNSWGTNWGQQGYGWLLKDFFDAGYVSDMWSGSTKLTADNFTFDSALDTIVQKGIFDSPDYWKAFEAKYNAGTLTNADFEYAFLGFRKFAAYLTNQG